MTGKDINRNKVANNIPKEGIRIKSGKSGKKAFSSLSPELLAAIRDGDHQAYDQFYLDTVDLMFDFINLLLHSQTEAEEICQQIYVRIWEARQSIDPAGNFRGYLYKMAKTAAFKHLEHKKVENKYLHYKQHDAPEFGASPDEWVITREIALLIKISLDNMPEQRRKVFEMSRNEGLSYEEIAKRLNISNATVRSHISHAIKELKDIVVVVAVFLGFP